MVLFATNNTRGITNKNTVDSKQSMSFNRNVGNDLCTPPISETVNLITPHFFWGGVFSAAPLFLMLQMGGLCWQQCLLVFY